METLNGNKKAEEKLYITYKRKVNYFLLGKYRYTNDHLDNISDIMMKVFENLSKFDANKSRFDTWVINIARNYMIDKSRKKQPIYVSFNSALTNNCDFETSLSTYTSSSITLDMIEPASTYQSPDTQLETIDSLTHASAQISGASFSMLRMKYLEGYSYDDIGKEFNMNRKEVSSKLNYSKRKIIKGDK